MMIIHQPFCLSLGDEIIDKLQSGIYQEFRFIVAYAKTSGVNRLLPSMREFKQSGGRIYGVVGIDQFNTSYEALKSLNTICDELYIYHSEDPMKTFHVKAYLLRGPSENWITVGSNNLTAGGLFSNYEASITQYTNSSEEDQGAMQLFNSYTNSASPCCKKADNNFIDNMLTANYIQSEKSIANRRITEISRQKNRESKDILFGKDKTEVVQKIRSAGKQPMAQPPQPTAVDDTDYLVRFVPKAGGRTNQVHFTMDILDNYFKMAFDDHLKLQQIHDIYSPEPIEDRKINLSARNRNVKIEIKAAATLNVNYPTDENKRPILLFRKVNPTFFEYMLILDGNAGYDLLNNYLHSIPWNAKSLAYEYMNCAKLLSIWDECPLI